MHAQQEPPRVLQKLRRISLRAVRPVVNRVTPPNRVVLGDVNSRFQVLGWRTADIHDADYVINFRDAVLPFPNGSVQLIYCSHMIEHISNDSAAQLFSEVYRVLEPGGTARFVCPDMDKLRGAYARGDSDFFLIPPVLAFLEDGIARKGFPRECLLLHNNVLRTHASYGDTGEGPYAPEEVVRENFERMDKHEFGAWCVSLLDRGRLRPQDPWGHVNAWDADKLVRALEEAGFTSAKRSAFRQSAVAELRDPRFDLAKHEWISLYVEARK